MVVYLIKSLLIYTLRATYKYIISLMCMLIIKLARDQNLNRRMKGLKAESLKYIQL